MHEQNLVKFDEVAKKVLGYLKMSFPIPSDLGPESLRLDISAKGEYDPESGGTTGGEPETEDEQFFGPVIEWLFLSGYIHAKKSSHYSGYYGLVLTEKGLDIMGMKPISLNRR
ncbi:hypothetical protein M2397_000514 [Pseudomonas sp. BIGb0381]|uniref:hypothetical protein n=1 Tax=Pseudomonas sp. BIGb0381 TaxID=2940608 RepID=UPI002167E955|nr:hypothetical protein [Pseudomonas sp. BIGb0381]MCS4310239.1 hypothetical protein [Pseudomonas sp. BIGb0381]